MKKVARSILAVIAGFVAASAVMMAIETINGHVLYPELGKMAEGMTDREAIRALMASAPVGAFLVALFGWALGSFVGGFLAAWIGRSAPVAHALGLGVCPSIGMGRAHGACASQARREEESMWLHR